MAVNRYLDIFYTILSFILLQALAGQTGAVYGTVTDLDTRSPLVGVNVLVLDTDFGAATDADGRYLISDLPVGTYNISFQRIGYESLQKLNIPVSPDRQTLMDAALSVVAIESEAVTIRARAFTKARGAVVSDRNVDFTELRRDPGGAMDIQRIMQVLPSVVSGTDQENEIIVRGGSPGENLFLMDNIELPNPNHFGTQGVGGGPISLVNSLFINEVDFFAGAFPARYGGRASSVMDISLKEGNRSEFNADIDMGMAGVGCFIEGPVFDGSCSYMLGFHKSYLELVADSFGMTAIPEYYSLQGKVVWFLSPQSKLIWNGIWGDDAIFIDEEENDGISRGADVVDVVTREYATGFTLKTLFDKNAYALITASAVGNLWQYDVEDYNDRIDDYVLQYQKDDSEQEFTLKADYFKRFSDRFEAQVGGQYKWVDFSHQDWAGADTVWTYAYWYQDDEPQEFHWWNMPADLNTQYFIHTGYDFIYPEWQLDQDIHTAKWALYLQGKWRPAERLSITAGLRYRHFNYTGESMLAPRAGFSYKLTDITSLNYGYGMHFQDPAYSVLTRNTDGFNRSLDCKSTSQHVLGLEHFFAPDFKGTIELYHKEYENLAVDSAWVARDSLYDYQGKMVSAGSGYSQGIELFLQKKLSRDFNFTFSYSHYVSKARDVRREDEQYFTQGFDFRDVLTFVGGYRWRMREQYPWYMKLREKPWYHFVDWLLPFADEVEFSVRWRYTRGKPFTSQTYDPYYRGWSTLWAEDLNRERLPDYHRLDFMLIRRWIGKSTNFVVYIDVMNVYHRKNIWEYGYNDDGSRENIYQFSLFPVGGFTLEF